MYKSELVCICQTSKKKIIKNCKYLGIVMCRILNLNDYFNLIANKIRKIMYAFKYVADILLECKTIRMVYKALVESIMNYNISIWGVVYEQQQTR